MIKPIQAHFGNLPFRRFLCCDIVKNKERTDTYRIPIMMATGELFFVIRNKHKSITVHNIPKRDERTSLITLAYVAKIIKDRQTIVVELIDNSSIFQMNFLFRPLFFDFDKKLQRNLFMQ